MNVAFIPVRGGSKSIPLKNIKLINGYPLVYWTIKAAVESKSIDAVYVSTDSEIIKSTVYDFSFKNVFIIEHSYEQQQILLQQSYQCWNLLLIMNLII